MADLNEYDAPGLPANWLNAWLAAIGVTVLVPEAKLSWTDEVVPHAVFHVAEGVDLVAAIGASLPSIEDLRRAPIARRHPESSYELPRNVARDAYCDRARLERATGGFLLAASVSDLEVRLDPANLPHGAFDPTAPRGETLWSRAVKCRELLDAGDARTAVAGTLAGLSLRVEANGLGFDCRRLVAGDRPGKVRVDPVVELLVLSSLRLFPVRGGPHGIRQRGFTGPPSRRGSFTWSCWPEPLDRWAIDALLDLRPVGRPAWHLVPFATAASDNTRAYFSEPVT